MRLRIVVADQAETRFYDSIRYGRPLKLAGTLRNPAGRLHERDIVADRPGRTLGRAVRSGGLHRSGPTHAVGGERPGRRHAMKMFARRVAVELERAYRARRFERLVLVAGPTTLGSLREALPAGLVDRVALTLPKDVVQRQDWDLWSHIPREIFSHAFEGERRRA